MHFPLTFPLLLSPFGASQLTLPEIAPVGGNGRRHNPCVHVLGMESIAWPFGPVGRKAQNQSVGIGTFPCALEQLKLGYFLFLRDDISGGNVARFL